MVGGKMASIKIYSKEQVDGLLPTSTQLVPSGGSTGQVLTKSASGTEWTTPSAGINVVQSTGSSTSDVMSQKAVTDNLPSSSQLVPTLGSAGQVLTVNSGGTGTEWITPSSGSSGISAHSYTTMGELVTDIIAHPIGILQYIGSDNASSMLFNLSVRDTTTVKINEQSIFGYSSNGDVVDIYAGSAQYTKTSTSLVLTIYRFRKTITNTTITNGGSSNQQNYPVSMLRYYY